MTDLLDIRRRRALWRATHRGTKELDWLIGRFAAARLAGMGDDDLERFEALLALPDPELQSMLMAVAVPAADGFRAVIAAIRAFHGLAAAQA